MFTPDHAWSRLITLDLVQPMNRTAISFTDRWAHGFVRWVWHYASSTSSSADLHISKWIFPMFCVKLSLPPPSPNPLRLRHEKYGETWGWVLRYFKWNSQRPFGTQPRPIKAWCYHLHSIRARCWLISLTKTSDGPPKFASGQLWGQVPYRNLPALDHREPQGAEVKLGVGHGFWALQPTSIESACPRKNLACIVAVGIMDLLWQDYPWPALYKFQWAWGVASETKALLCR